MNSIMDILNIPFGYILSFCHMLLPNYALALLLFALIMKIILFPLGIKQQKNMVKQAALRPKEMAIRKRYAGRTDKPTQQKMNEEVMNLYQKENFNPMGGCLPVLLQFPIIIALYNVIRNPLTYICRIGDRVQGIKDALVNLNLMTVTENGIYKVAATGATVSGEIDFIGLIRDNASSLTEALGDFDVSRLPNFGIFGNAIDLAQTPRLSEVSWLLLIPIITFAAVFFSMKLTRKFSYQAPQQNGGDSAALSMKIMDLTMPLFSVWITFTVPAVIGLYWIYQNILGVAQQIALSKMYPIPQFTEEDMKKAEKEMNGTVKKEKPKVRSLHHIDDDDEPANQKNNTGKTDANPAAGVLGKAPLKDDKNNALPPEKKPGQKPKVRSLHHIDDEDEIEEGSSQENSADSAKSDK